jgi:large subunit ribosomal protein L25
MQTVTIEGVVRQNAGTKYAKALRREGNVPCVLYGGDKVVHFHAAKSSFKKLIYTTDFKLADVSVDGANYRAILKDAQFHPVTDEVLHVDFIELVPEKLIKAQVPVRITGSSPGVKGGGKLQQSLRKVSILSTPENLVDNVTVDISGLELGDSIRVRDIAVQEGIEVLNPAAIPVASIVIPRALRSAMMGETEGEEEEAV